MSATVKIRMETDGAKQAAAEARGLGRLIDGLRNKSFRPAIGPAVTSFRNLARESDTMAAAISRAGSRAGRALAIGLGAGTVAVGAGLVSSIRKATAFEAELSRLGAVSNATASQMKALDRQAMQLGASTSYSAREAAQAQVELAKGGLSVKDILGGALPAALQLAAAGELELADAATYTVNAMKVFGIAGEDVISVSDAFAVSANQTTADVQHFGMALTQGGAAAKLAGYDFQDTMVWLNALAESGVKGSDAGTSMKAALTQLAAPSARAAKLARELGIQWTDSNGAIKDAEGLSRELTTALEGKNEAERLNILTTLAGTDGMRALAALHSQGVQNLAKLRRGLEQEGYAAEVAARKLANLQGRTKLLNSALETIQINVGRAAIPALSRLAEYAAREWMPRLVRVSEQLEDIWNDSSLSVADKWSATLDSIDATGLPDKLREGLYAGLTAVATEGPKLLIRGLAEAPWPAKGLIAGILLSKLAPAIRAAGILLGGAKGPAGAPAMPTGPLGAPGRSGGVVPVFVTNATPALGVGPGGRRVPNVGGLPAGGILVPPGRSPRTTPVPMPVPTPAPGRSGLGGRIGPAALLGLTAGTLTAAGAGAAGAPGGGLIGQMAGGAAFGAMMGSVAGPKGALVGALAGGAFAGLTAGFRRFAGSGEDARLADRVEKRTTELSQGLDRMSRAPIESAVRRLEETKRRLGVEDAVARIASSPGVRIRPEDRAEAARSSQRRAARGAAQIAEDQRAEGLAVAKGFAQGLRDGARFIGEADLFRETKERFDKLTPEGQKAASRTMLAFAREAESAGRIPAGAADRFIRRLANTYDSLAPLAGKSAKAVGQQFALEREMKGSLIGVDKAFAKLQDTFSDAPRVAKTSLGNLRRNTDEAFTFLTRKAKSSDDGIAKAARGQIRSMMQASDRVAKANAAMGRSFDAPSDAAISAAAAISGAAGRARSAWASVAASISSQLATASGQIAAFAARMAATTIPAPRVAPIRVPGLFGGRAHGGYVGNGYAGGGFTTGPYRGYDDRLVPLAGNEAVLTPRQQAMVPGGRSTLTRIFRATGGALSGAAGYAKGGFLDTDEGKALLKALREAGVDDARAVALRVHRATNADPAGALGEVTGFGSIAATRASLNVRRRMRGKLDPEALAEARERAADQAEATHLRKDLAKLTRARGSVEKKMAALRRDLRSARSGTGGKGRINAALANMTRQRRQLTESIEGIRARLADIDDAAAVTAETPAPEPTETGEDLASLDNFVATSGRDDSLQDKQTGLAATEAAKARGVTNPEKLQLEAERAIAGRRRDEVQALAARVKRSWDRALARRKTLLGQRAGTYKSLRKTKISNAKRRADLRATIARINEEIDEIDGRIQGLADEHADYTAQANELGFDIEQLDLSLRATPDVEPESETATTTPTTPAQDGDTTSPQVQAQLAAARAEAAASGALLKAAFSPGDIGAGGLFGIGAAGGPPINFNLLHPGTPGIQAEIARLVTGAFGVQAPRPSKASAVNL